MKAFLMPTTIPNNAFPPPTNAGPSAILPRAIACSSMNTNAPSSTTPGGITENTAPNAPLIASIPATIRFTPLPPIKPSANSGLPDMARTPESIAENNPVNILVNPRVMFCIKSLSAPNQPSATSEVMPMIIGIKLDAIAEKVDNTRLCRVPNSTTTGLIFVIMTVNPTAIVAVKPITKDCPNGIKVPRESFRNPSPFDAKLTIPASAPDSLSVNIEVISNPTLPSLVSAKTRLSALPEADLP